METKDLLNRLSILIKDVNANNGANYKMDTLEKYPECKKILNYIYDPMKMFHVTSKRLEKMDYLNNSKQLLVPNNIFDMLDMLIERFYTGHDALNMVYQFTLQYPEYKGLIYNIVDKDLKIGMGTSNINKVFKGLIPKFEVALANSYDKVKGKIDIEDFYASQKLDGLRCVAIKKNKDVRFYTRQGKEFLTLDKVKEEIMKTCIFENAVFDGELCIVDENGNEDFKAITKVYKKKDFTIPNPKYKIFDLLSLEEFESKTSTRIFSERYNKLKALLPEDSVILDVLEQVPLNEETFAEMQKEASDKGWEGLILRKDTVYKGKRSNDILKVKKFFDAEYIVKSVDTGPFQVVKSGERMEIETLTAVHIEHKGYDVKVGSGFSLEQREYYFKHPEEIVGKTITVNYFEETYNDKGEIKLRFPTLKHIYDNGRDV